MVGETNPGVLELANRTEAPHAAEHGYRTIGDIMRSLNPLEGEFYREALQVSRSTREMFCLMEGRHVHPSTLYPGGVGTTATVQLFTDYLTRLMRYVEFMKRVVPMHDDLFDFFYEALPGYEEVGRRRADMVCWGSLNDPEYCDFRYENMTDWGRKMFVSPGVIRDGQLLTNDLVEINLGIRILLGSSYYEDWEDQEMFVTRDAARATRWTAGTRGTSTRSRGRSKRDFDDKYSWVMSPRWFDGTNYLAADTGGGPIARLWATAQGGLVDFGYVKSTGHSVLINLPRTMTKPEVTFEWKMPDDKTGAPLSNAIERDRARTYFQAYAAACALYFVEKALAEIRAGRTKTWEPFSVPDEAISCGFTEAVRGVLSHHMVIRGGKIANYHPYPPTPWNASVRDSYGTPGPYEDAVQNTPIFEENPPENFKGIDIMRAVRSFDPCLPCGVHMYLGGGKVRWTRCTRRWRSPCPPDRGRNVARPWRRPADRRQSLRTPAPAAAAASATCGPAADGGESDDPRATGRRPDRGTADGAAGGRRHGGGGGRGTGRGCWSACTATAWPTSWPRCATRARPAPRCSTGSPRIRWSRACCCCTGCTRSTSTRGSSGRWTGSGPTWARTPAGCSTSGSPTASPGCGWRAAATAARPRPSPCSWPSRARCKERRPR